MRIFRRCYHTLARYVCNSEKIPDRLQIPDRLKIPKITYLPTVDYYNEAREDFMILFVSYC
jgi:hypothetical protein